MPYLRRGRRQSNTSNNTAARADEARQTLRHLLTVSDQAQPVPPVFLFQPGTDQERERETSKAGEGGKTGETSETCETGWRSESEADRERERDQARGRITCVARAACETE